ncbi:MAG TPA: hypothetical protein VLK84_22970 [Longimicrobium sp.]|nr:hypothetical protein [Longimicrobium sp.]
MYRKALAFLLAAAPLAAAPATAQTALRVGQTVTGSLEAGDPAMEDGALYDAYVITGRPGDRVVIQMQSGDFDTYLRWGRQENGEWTETVLNDDSGEGTDSRLVVTLNDEGGYELRAGAFGEGEAGAYTLVLSTPAPLRIGRLPMDESVRGEITEDDYEGEGGIEDHYTVTGRAGEVVTVWAESTEFDTYLSAGTWNGGRFVESGSDDDGGVSTGSQLVTEIPAGGSLHVIVRSFSGEVGGPYVVGVGMGAAEVVEEVVEEDEGDFDGEGEDFEGEGDEGMDAEMVGTFAGAVQANGDMAGTLGDGPADENDIVQYYREYSYRAAAGERLSIHVRGTDLDPYVSIGRGQGEAFEALAEDDDGGEELNALLEFEVPEAGTYTIRVTSAYPGQAGPFVLRVGSGR